MPLKKLNIKIKIKIRGRATSDIDYTVVFDAMKSVWTDLEQGLKDLSEEEAAEMKSHFNELIDGEEDLGDILFGS